MTLRGALLALCLTTAARAQEFITVVPNGEPPDTSFVRLAMFPRASLRLPESLATFPDARANAALYLWLATAAEQATSAALRPAS